MADSAGDAAHVGTDVPPDRARQARRARARKGEGDRLRAEIVQAASRLLALTGDAGSVSLRAVAREVGIATTSIYLHFANLDALILAVKTDYFAEFGTILDDAAELAGPVSADRVRARAHAYVGYGVAHPGRYRAMFAAPMLPPELASQVARSGAEVFEALQREVAATIGGPELEAHMLAVHLWTALHGIVSLRAARPHFGWTDSVAEVDSLVAWLLPTWPSPGPRTDRRGTSMGGRHDGHCC